MTWADRGNPPKVQKYAFVERSYAVESDDETELAPDNGANDSPGPKKRKDWKPPESKLDPAIQDLMRLVFNQRYFDAAMLALNYDADKLPMGKLNKAAITRGVQALKDLTELFDNPSLAANVH